MIHVYVQCNTFWNQILKEEKEKILADPHFSCFLVCTSEEMLPDNEELLQHLSNELGLPEFIDDGSGLNLQSNSALYDEILAGSCNVLNDILPDESMYSSFQSFALFQAAIVNNGGALIKSTPMPAWLMA